MKNTPEYWERMKELLLVESVIRISKRGDTTNWDDIFQRTIIDSIQNTILHQASSKDDALTGIASLISQLRAINWDALFEERQKKVDAYMNEIIPCMRCGQHYQRCEMENNRDTCKSCSEKNHAEYIAKYFATCCICGQQYRKWVNKHSSDYFCPSCHTPIYANEAIRVSTHLERARASGVEATLTVREWLTTLDHFEWKCAYCLAPFKGLEHYIPIISGGGTTKTNCIPSCKQCNTRKRDRHPDELDGLFPPDNLARIRSYLASVS